jgi:hypothetical protein
VAFRETVTQVNAELEGDLRDLVPQIPRERKDLLLTLFLNLLFNSKCFTSNMFIVPGFTSKRERLKE